MGCFMSKKATVPDDTVTYFRNTTVAPPPPAPKKEKERKPIVVPSDPDFHWSLNGRRGYRVKDVYDFGSEVGKGAFGAVCKAKHKVKPRNGEIAGWQHIAIKKTEPTILDKQNGPIKNYRDVEANCAEIRTLIRLREAYPEMSPVLYLYEYFFRYDSRRRTSELYMVSELLGQELDQWRQQQTIFIEGSAKKICTVVLNALDFMHSRQVVHRDIKLQNILFRVKGDFNTLKIVDFGLAKTLDNNAKARDFCGSLGYIAPEIYKGEEYGYEVDMFALGVMVFRLLSGVRPFSSTNTDKLRRDTIDLKYSVKGRSWEGVSPEALKMVRKLLIGKEQRLSALEAIDHEWFSAGGEESVLRADYSQSRDYVPDDSYSKAIALSHAPTAPADGSRYWLDDQVEIALNVLMAEGKFCGRLLPDTGSSEQNNEGLVCVEELSPPNVRVLPNYVARLQHYSEKDCRRICRQMAQIIKISHDNGMAHRNIHMNNWLLDKNGNVMVRGLQYAQAIAEDTPLTGHFGYLYSWYAFKAPEIDSDFFHDKTVDLWSLGATIYMLLCAVPPFRGDGADLIMNKHDGNVVFDMIQPSDAAQQLIRGLLQVNPENRLTIEQVLDSEWMIDADDVLETSDLGLTHCMMQDWDDRAPSTSMQS